MLPYSITVTTRDGLQPPHLDGFKDWFKRNTESCLVVVEKHASGKLHLHAGTQQKDKSTNQVTRKLTTLCNTLNIPIQPRITLRVKKTTDLIGWFHYLTKDLDGEPLLIQGWQMTWIQQQCKDNLKKVPHKMVKGDDYTMTMATAPNLVIAYAKRAAVPLTGKDSFKTVLCLMARDGYQLHNLKIKILYAEVMARFDDFGPLRSWLDQELDWL